MTTNDLVYKVAERARTLANKPLLSLRLSVANCADTVTGAVTEVKHLSRGELIEEILTEEFIEEFPQDISSKRIIASP